MTFQTIKIVDNETTDEEGKGEIVGFITWAFDHECKRDIKEPPRPEGLSRRKTSLVIFPLTSRQGSDFRLLEDFRAKLAPVYRPVFNPNRHRDVKYAHSPLIRKTRIMRGDD